MWRKFLRVSKTAPTERRPPRRRVRGMPVRALLVAVVLFVSGCSVGPDYVRPTAPTAPAFSGDSEQEGWKTAEPRDEIARGTWWEIYGDPELNQLEEQVAAANQNLFASEAQFRQAVAVVEAARSSWYPQAAIGFSMARARQSDNLFGNLGGSGNTVNDFSMPISVAWEPDLWGRVRRNVESQTAGAQASAADIASTQLSLQATLAADYFQLRTIDADRALLDRSAAAFEYSLKLTQSRFAGGVASRADVAQAQTQLETTQAQAIDLGVQRAQLEHAIAVLVGVPASGFSVPVRALDTTPPSLPVGVPSELLERRPDVAAAERLAASANAQIGVALSAYYPIVTLSASGGLELGLLDWLQWPSRFWSAGPSISETIYDGGLRAAQTAQARAAFDANVALYRQSVLAAFQEVEDNLAALRILANESRVLDEAVAAARDSEQLTTNRYKEGTVSYLDVVITQTTALNNERTAVDVLGRRMVASVNLVQALGGGWDASGLPTGKDMRADVNVLGIGIPCSADGKSGDERAAAP